MELEQLACNGMAPVDFEHTLFQALVNEGKHIRVLNAKRPQFTYNEKQLRDAAAAEVALGGNNGGDDEIVVGADGKPTRKRKSLNPDEKAKQNRDRNREHAKNTRLRKKAYVMKLKELVDQMNGQKDLEERERRALGERIYDTHIIRKNAVRLMLSYRAANVRDREKWAAILDEGFVFTLPITPYRSFQKGDIVSSSRVIVGIDAAIADAASLALMVENVGMNSELWKETVKRGQSCRVVYISGKDDMLAAGDLIICRYLMRTEGHEVVGAFSPCVQHGMLQCRFNKQNKMVSAEMMFDVMGFMQQLQRASAVTPESSIVPNTIDMAMHPSREARAIVKAEPHFPLMHINDTWANLSGSGGSGGSMDGTIALGDALRLHPSQEEQLYALAADCSIGRAGSAILMTIHPNSTGIYDAHDPSQLALIYLKLLPLTGNNDLITHFLCVQIDLPLTQTERCALMAHCTSGAFASSMAAAAAATQFHPQQQAYDASSSSSSNTLSTIDINNDFATGSGLAPTSISTSTAPSTSSSTGLSTGPSTTTTTNSTMHPCRIQGELLYRHHRQQYQMRQERVSDAQLSDAYFLLSANAPPNVALPTNTSTLPSSSKPLQQGPQNHDTTSFSLQQASSSSSGHSYPSSSSSSSDTNPQHPSSSSSSSSSSFAHSTHPTSMPYPLASTSHTQSHALSLSHPQSHPQTQSHNQTQSSHGQIQSHVPIQGQDMGCASSHSLFYPDEDLAAVIAQGIGGGGSGIKSSSSSSGGKNKATTGGEKTTGKGRGGGQLKQPKQPRQPKQTKQQQQQQQLQQQQQQYQLQQFQQQYQQQYQQQQYQQQQGFQPQQPEFQPQQGFQQQQQGFQPQAQNFQQFPPNFQQQHQGFHQQQPGFPQQQPAFLPQNGTLGPGAMGANMMGAGNMGAGNMMMLPISGMGLGRGINLEMGQGQGLGLGLGLDPYPDPTLPFIGECGGLHMDTVDSSDSLAHFMDTNNM